jgi:membrane-associated phospholipid phosphatase
VAVVTGVLVIAVTRLYLGVHWLSDVTAGAVLGAVWVTVGATVLRASCDRPDHSRWRQRASLADAGVPSMITSVSDAGDPRSGRGQ